MKKSILYSIISLIPFVAFAQAVPQITDFKSLINFILYYLNLLMPLVFGLMFLIFVWGIVISIKNSDDPEGIKKGKKFMVVSVVVFFVALSFRALYTFIADDIFGADGANGGMIPLLDRTKLEGVLPAESGGDDNNDQ